MTKPTSEFHRDNRKKDGLCYRCKRCTSKAKEWRTCADCGRNKPYEPKFFFKDDEVCKSCRETAGSRRCRHCRKVKPFVDFYAKQGTCSSVCRRCHDRLYAKTHGERRIQREFGLTPQHHRQMLKRQGGVCAICGCPKSKMMYGKVLALHIDHDHILNTVRGLLCADCNLGIGRFHDDPELLRRAADYLEREQDAQG